jgi:hypothetical protein
MLTTPQGFFTRWWQLGIQMRPFFERKALIAYPIYMAAGASFGYWLQNVDERQTEILQDRKHRLLEKRARKSERDAERAAAAAEA